MALNFKQGTYTGNGSTTQAITGVGFQPKVVIISSNQTGADINATLFKTANMTTGASGQTANLGENGIATLGAIDSLDSDGFTVRGTTDGKNVNTKVYYYIAIGGSDCATGTYTGNGTDGRAITGLGFQPGWVVIEGNNQHTVQKPSSTGDATDKTLYFTVLGELTNAIQSLDSDGFTLGNNTQVNLASGSPTYYWFAVKNDTNYFKSGSYVGNETDNRDITGVGFQPEFVLIKAHGTAQARARVSSMSGDTAFSMRASTPASNAIQSFASDGFQIGTSTDVNASAINTYYYVAMRTPAGVDVSVSATVLSATFSLPASTVTATQSVTVSPSALSATFSIPVYTVTADGAVSISASVLSATFSLPVYTVSAIQNTTISSSVLSATFSIPTYSVSTTVSLSPSVLSATFSIPTYSVLTPDALAVPSVLTATFSIPVFTVTATRSVDVASSVLSATFSLPTVTVTANVSVDVTPSALSATFSVPTYTPVGTSGVTVSATVLTATFSVPTYTATGTENVTISASVLTGTFSIPTYAISLVQTVSPSALSATFTIPAYTVTAIQNVSLSPSVVVLSFTIPTYFARGDFWQEKYATASTSWSDKGYNGSNNWTNKY